MTKTMSIRMDRENLEFLNELKILRLYALRHKPFLRDCKFESMTLVPTQYVHAEAPPRERFYLLKLDRSSMRGLVCLKNYLFCPSCAATSGSTGVPSCCTAWSKVGSSPKACTMVGAT